MLSAALAAILTALLVPAAPAAAPAPAPAVEVHHAHAQAVTGSTVATTPTTGSTYRFQTVVAGQPVRWNPCAPIRWQANLAKAPAGGLDVLKTAVASVAARTGTTWVYAGTTTRVPTSSYLPRTSSTTYAPVLLGWTDGGVSDLLAGQPAAVYGMSRHAWFGTTDATGTRAAIRTGVVALDRTDRLPLTGAQSWRAVVEHELGHVMGLAHPTSTTQLLSSVMPRTAAGYQAGDVAGLAKVGRAAGCIPGTF